MQDASNFHCFLTGSSRDDYVIDGVVFYIDAIIGIFPVFFRMIWFERFCIGKSV